MQSVIKNCKVTMIPVGSIDPSPFQARCYFNKQDLITLAESIRQNGILQPLTVRRISGGRFQLVAGERRLRAAKLCNMEYVPCLIATVDEMQSTVLGLVENLHRRDLNCFEEARGIKELLVTWGCTQAEAARRLGMAQPTLANKLRLLALSEDQQHFCLENELTARHVRAVLRLDSEEARKKILQQAAKKKWTVETTEKAVDRACMEIQPRNKGKRKGAVRDVRIFINTLNKAVELMKNAGLPATAVRTDKEDYIEYLVRIPTKADSLHITQA